MTLLFRSVISRLLIVILLSITMLAVPMVLPEDAPVPTVLQVTPAEASDVRDCAAVVGAMSGNAWALVAAAVQSPYCGAWLGKLNASTICWGSRQWWGWTYRGIVWTITGGRYTRC